MRLLLFLLSLVLFSTYFIDASAPLVVFPPFFKLHEENTLSIINEKAVDTIVEIQHGSENTRKAFKGKHFSFPFRLTAPSPYAQVKLSVGGKEVLQRNVSVRPDLFNVHIHIDKTVYRISENVKVRILPITHSGNIYNGDLKIFLINNKGFVETATVIVRKATESEPIISEELRIPFYTFFGQWKVIVQPVESLNDELMAFTEEFQVQDYDLPNFRLSGYLNDSSLIEDTQITLEAKYFHGKPVNGTAAIYCKTVGSVSSDRKNLKPVENIEFTNGIWSGKVNLTKCDPFNLTSKEIFVEARENGTGYRQELTLPWDVISPKFTLTPIKPYFTDDSTDIYLLVDGIGISHGNINILIESIPEEKPNKNKPKELQMISRIGELVKIEIPDEWKKITPVIRVTAKRQISHGWSNTTMLYIPNLANTTLKTILINPENPKEYYKEGETMSVAVLDGEYHYIAICNSHTIHRIPNDIRNNILKIKISEKMEGTCILSAFNAENKTSGDVMLFRVQKFCEDCSLQISKRNVNTLKSVSSSDIIEPGDQLEFEYSGQPYAIVFYRAIDERLNYITLTNDYLRNSYQDYLIVGDLSTSAQMINFVNLLELETAMKTVCTKAGMSIRFECQQGVGSPSLVSEKCLGYVLKACFKETTAVTQAVTNSKTIDIQKANVANGWFDLLKRPPRPPLPIRQRIEFNDPGIQKHQKQQQQQAISTVKIRKNFPETWLFDAIVLERNGTKKIVSTVPDNIGQWALMSAFWWKGKVGLYPTETKYLQTSKGVFMEIDMPRNVYVNETISPLVTVTALELKKSRAQYVICLDELPRKVCADQGTNGKKGKTYYMKVEMTRESPIQSKYLMLKFLSPGSITMNVTLREDNCEDGKIVDFVQKEFVIQKRADTETYYEKHILNPSKPMMNTPNEDDEEPRREMKTITFSDQHGSSDGPDTINTLITSNVPDSETVFSFTITLSRILRNKGTSDKILNRFKRSGPSFLIDVIQRLAVALYDFKGQKLEGETSYQLEASINDLINEMMLYSNCTSKKEECGYGKFGKPDANDESVSILLTSLATSLLCEADVEESRVIGSLKTIISFIKQLKHKKEFDEDLSDIVDVEDPEDRKFLIISFVNQVSKDCAAYRNSIPDMSKTFAIIHTKYFYNLDETNVKDGRTAAAIAFMATNVTTQLMRSELIGKLDTNHEPFLKCNSQELNRLKKPQLAYESFRRRRQSCETMVNSLLLSAIATSYADGHRIDWDRLADWILEQQENDGAFGSPLSSLAASRAIYEKRRRAVEIAPNQHLEVIIKCKGCPERRVNVTENAVQISISPNIRYINLITTGKGKAVVSARIVATKRPRPKRGLTQDDYYPVHFKINQQVEKQFVKQNVCFFVNNPTIRTLDIFHGAFTSFVASVDKLDILNSTYQPINPTSSALGLHFILTDIMPNQTICYNVALSESPGQRRIILPDQSAPVPIRATHPVHGLVGMLLVAHPDVPNSDVISRKRRSVSTRTRFVRRIVDETAVDTVCYDKGECACAETSCNVECNQCQADSIQELRKILEEEDRFGIRFEVTSKTNLTVNGAHYTILDGTIKDSKGGVAEMRASNKIRVWMRSCNDNCIRHKPNLENSDCYILGYRDGLNYDSFGRYNYVLNHSDRFEVSAYECSELHNAITIRV